MTIAFRRSVLAVLAALGLAGAGADASAQAPAVAQAAPTASAPAAAGPTGYRVGPEDVLEISVWREDTLRKETLVRPDGGISYPLIGDVRAAGRTVEEIRDDIAKRLDKYIPDPVVSVTVVKTGSQRVYVIGKVAKPGEFAVGRYVDVLQALSMAGGLTSFADSGNIRVMRRDGDRQAVFPFDYGAVVRGQKIEENILLRAGDVVVVP